MRQNAVDFVEKAKERLSGQANALFEDALVHYTIVSENLGMMAEANLWILEVSDDDAVPVDDKNCTGVDALQAAKEAEADEIATFQMGTHPLLTASPVA